MKKIQIILTVLCIMTLSGCKSSFNITENNFQDHQFQVATADDNYSLTMPVVYDAIYNSDLLNLGGVLDTTIVRKFIDSLVLDSIIGFEANHVDLGKDYNFNRMYKLRYYDLIVKKYLKNKVYDKAISDSLEIVEYYYANEKMFAIEEQIDLYHIAFAGAYFLQGPDSLNYRKLSPEELDKAVYKYADSVKSLITSPDKFPEIASQFSEDVVAARDGGHLGWTKRGKHPAPFDSVAFELRDGDLGGPYKDVNGWHVIMADNYYPAGLQPINEFLYSAAKKNLEMAKSNQIGRKLIDSLFTDFDVLLNDDIVNENIYIIDGTIWGAIINGIDTIDCNEARSLELTYREKNRVENTTPEMKKQMFRKLGEKYVIIQAARNTGVENDSSVTVQRNELTHKYNRALVTKNRIDPKWSPTDSLVEEYYNNNIEDYLVDKPLKVQHIIVTDSLFGEFLRDQAMSGIDFLQLAKEHYPGEESIRNELADLGDIGENDVSKEFFNVAETTPIGEVSHPVKTEFGYHIIKVLQVNKTRSLINAKRSIVSTLKKEYQEKFYKSFQDNLFSKFNVKSVGKLYPVHLKPKSLREMQ